MADDINGAMNGVHAVDGTLSGHAADGLPDGADQQMEQIRDLLFGALRQEMAGRMEVLERRVAALERGLAEARQADVTTRRQSFDQLATAIADLGSQVRTLAKS